MGVETTFHQPSSPSMRARLYAFETTRSWRRVWVLLLTWLGCAAYGMLASLIWMRPPATVVWECFGVGALLSAILPVAMSVAHKIDSLAGLSFETGAPPTVEISIVIEQIPFDELTRVPGIRTTSLRIGDVPKEVVMGFEECALVE